MKAAVKEHQGELIQGGYQPQGNGPKPPAPMTGSGVVPASDAANLMAVISRAASDPTVDIDKMERLIAMHNGMVARQNEQAFNDAMTAAQKQMRRVAADSNNPQTRSKYASYAALDRAIRPVYTEHGFSLTFNTGEAAEGFVRVICDVANAGFTRTYHIDMPADGKGAKGGDVMTKTHATGSAITYGRRYLMAMIFNLAVGDDDDGNAAAEPVETITDEQVKELSDLLISTKSNLVLFLKAIKLESLTQIRADKFEAAKKLINETAKKRAEREQQK